MYLHIGKDIVLNKKDILFIFDYENLKDNKIFQNFLEKIDKKDIIDISDDKEKNIIKAYISNISSTTLSKRGIKF